MSPFDTVRMILTFYGNYSCISCRFWDIQCRKSLNLKIGVRGHSRSL